MSGTRAIILVARREIRERLHSRAFLWSTFLMLVVVGGSTGLGGVISTEKSYRVAAVAPAPAGLAAALQRAAAPFDAKVRLRTFESLSAGRNELGANNVDALLVRRLPPEPC